MGRDHVLRALAGVIIYRNETCIIFNGSAGAMKGLSIDLGEFVCHGLIAS
jgi:hypothetical protein